MKNHLKRLTSPKSWALPRRENVFIVRPKPGGHPLNQGLPLGILLRDVLKLASTMPEVRKVLGNKEVLVDGKRRKDYRFIVGIFDIVSIPSTHKHYRMLLDEHGSLSLMEIHAQEASTKLCKITGKSVIAKGQIQFHLHDGRNIVGKQNYLVGTSLQIKIPSQEIQKEFPLLPGAKVYLTQGKNAGSLGTLKSVSGEDAVYIAPGGQEVGTVKRYLFVVGEQEPAISLGK